MTTSVYQRRPWLARYDPDQPSDIEPEYRTGLEMFQAAVCRDPDAVIVRYFDGTLTAGQLDEMSDGFAAGLLDHGITPGDRVALYLPNVPQFVIGLLGTWKAGGIAVPVNPMNRERDLDLVLRDSGAKAVVCLETGYPTVRAVFDGLAVTTSDLEYQIRDDPRVFSGAIRIDCDGALDMTGLIGRYVCAAPRALPGPGPDDVAFLTYPSGTTGPPKGTMNTHRNLVFSSQVYRDWVGIGPGDVVLGVAPLCHITGLVGHVGVSLLTGVPLVLCHRCEPSLVLDAVRETGATFTVGSITVFSALMNVRGGDREALTTLTKVYSDGAPIPPSTVRAFADRFGPYIRNSYGPTETTSPSHAVPLHATAPVDPVSGALSVGVPVYNTVVRIVGADGAELPPGEVGEIVTSGPQVVPGYWNQPEQTRAAIPGGQLRTGDVGYMDPDGWFYLLGRREDQMNVGAPKGWPRAAGRVPPLAGVDLAALRRFIDARDHPGTAGPLTGELISGGKSNLTYRISDGVRTWILRRPPLGLVLATAHDMSRECRVLRALAGTGVPVPDVVAQQETADVLDAPFYLMREVDGVVYRSRDQVAALTPEQAARLGGALVDTLATLHTVDYRAVGLDGFGRPEGYLRRQVTRWLRQWDAAHVHDYPEVVRLGQVLLRTLPAGDAAGIVHGDYRIDNVMVDRTDPGRIVAVLDWEMAALGDPLADLGILLSYWDEPGRPYNPVTGGLTAVPGFPSSAEVISRYARRRGRDLPNVDWYLGFADFKLAIILEQIHTRHVQGHTVGEGFDRVGEMVWPLLQRARATASRH